MGSEYRDTWSSGPTYPSLLDVRVLPDGRTILRGAPMGVAATAGAIATDGTSWLAGAMSSPRLHLAHYNAVGTLDPFQLAAGFFDRNSAAAPPTFLLPLSNGGVLALGSFVRADGLARAYVARFRRQ